MSAAGDAPVERSAWRTLRRWKRIPPGRTPRAECVARWLSAVQHRSLTIRPCSWLDRGRGSDHRLAMIGTEPHASARVLDAWAATGYGDRGRVSARAPLPKRAASNHDRRRPLPHGRGSVSACSSCLRGEVRAAWVGWRWRAGCFSPAVVGFLRRAGGFASRAAPLTHRGVRPPQRGVRLPQRVVRLPQRASRLAQRMIR